MNLNPSRHRSLYQATDLHFRYQLGAQKVTALAGVSARIESGECVGLIGPSGSGKTTLLGLLGLIEPLQEGSLEFNGQPLDRLSEKEKNAIRRHQIGFVFQNFLLFPVLSAFENVEYFLIRQARGWGGTRSTRAERAERVEESLRQVGLWEHRHKRPLEMSGGQRQRVAIARAMAKQPSVILADEPTASLDQATGRQVMEIFSRVNRERGVTVIFSSHDPMAQSFASRQIRLVDGRVLHPDATGRLSSGDDARGLTSARKPALPATGKEGTS